MNAEAKVCPTCVRNQNRYLQKMNISLPVLSLLVALVSVLVSGSEEIKTLLFGKTPKLLAVVETATSNNIALSILNEGNGAAVVSSLRCILEQRGGEKNKYFFYQAIGEKVIAPGEKGTFEFELSWSYLTDEKFSQSSRKRFEGIRLVSIAYAFGVSGGDGGSIPICEMSYDQGERSIGERKQIRFEAYDLNVLFSKLQIQE